MLYSFPIKKATHPVFGRVTSSPWSLSKLRPLTFFKTHRTNVPEAVVHVTWQRLSTSTAASCIAFSLKPTSLLISTLNLGMLNIVVNHILYAVQITAKLSSLPRVVRICLQMYDRLPGGEGGNSISLLYPQWPQRSRGCAASMIAPCYAVTPPDTSRAG